MGLARPAEASCRSLAAPAASRRAPPPRFSRSVPLSPLLPPLRAGLLPLRSVSARKPRSRLCQSPPYAAERP